MRQLLRQLWADDQGAIISIEYLFFVTIVVIGTVVGLTNVRDAINVELTETGNALMALSQGFAISGTNGAGGSTDGSQAIDIPGLSQPITNTAPAIPSFIEVSPNN